MSHRKKPPDDKRSRPSQALPWQLLEELEGERSDAVIVRNVRYGEVALAPVPEGAVVVEVVTFDKETGFPPPPKPEATVYQPPEAATTVSDAAGIGPAGAARPGPSVPGAPGTDRLSDPSASLAAAQVSSLPATAPSPAVPADSLPADEARAGTFKVPRCPVCHGSLPCCEDRPSACPRCVEASFSRWRNGPAISSAGNLVGVQLGEDPVLPKLDGADEWRPSPRRVRGRLRSPSAPEVRVHGFMGREPEPAVALDVGLLPHAQGCNCAECEARAAHGAVLRDAVAAFERLRARVHEPRCRCTECEGDRVVIETSAPSIRLAKPRRRS